MTKKSIKDLIISALAFVAIYVLFSLKQNSNGDKSPSRFSTETFETKTGWAYRIRQDTVTVIEQLSILHMEGNRGFETKEQALATAKLMKQKLDNGIFPPAISKSELDSLGVRY